MAEVALSRGFVRPQLVDAPMLDIRDGQHPMVAGVRSLNFACNDTHMDVASRFWLLTGPNMAGKSTYLRQVALIVVLAQAGSFVPASHATVGIVDAVLTRAGSTDNLVNDQSTFMCEMLETAHILNRATHRSLVIMDEVGRGTATADGFALATAVCEYLHDTIQCRTLFATHLHDLHKLRPRLSALVCKAVPAQLCPSSGALLFPHKVVDGVVSQSYGIHVARLAQVPDAVCRRAQAVMSQMQPVRPL
jgi:DNA mismatch repair protein MutS